MRVPSRVYVGVVVFGLITALITVPYTIAVFSGAHPPVPFRFLQVGKTPSDTGKKAFLLLASLFSVALVWVSWRALLQGARMDAARRKRHARLKRELAEYERDRRAREQAHREGKRPPGYT